MSTTSQEMSTDSDKSVEFPFNFSEYDTIIFCDQKPPSTLLLMVPGKWVVCQLVCGHLHNSVYENASCEHKPDRAGAPLQDGAV